MQTRVLKFVGRVLAFAILALLPVALAAQAASGSNGNSNQLPSRWDIFAGYSYLAPQGNLTATYTETEATSPVATTLHTNAQSLATFAPTIGASTVSTNAVDAGIIFSGAYYFNRYVGIQAEGAVHNWEVDDENGIYNQFTTISGGAIVRYPMNHFTPFVHVLVGGARTAVNFYGYYPISAWGPSFTGGGGLDYETPWFNHHLAIRIIQTDFVYMHENFGPGESFTDISADIDAARLSTGLVFHAGAIAPPPPVTLACSASPGSIYPGDPVTVTAMAGGLNPKDNVIYSWSGTGVTGNGTTATVATGSLAAGQYTIQATVREGAKGKEGLQPWEMATCTAGISVKAFEPPTISCSADPSTINPGDKSTITAAGVSPQNRPLTYSYSAAAGSISGAGTTATFDSTGAGPGAVTVTCNDSDDKGQSATADTLVTIAAPPPPPGPSPEQVRLEARLSLHSVFFPTDLPRAQHPEGGLLVSQQGTLSTLATDFKSYLAFKPDAHLILTGHTDVRASVEYNQSLSERRVNRAKQFLVAQGVPEASIETRAVGKEQELSADQVRDLVNQNTELTDAERTKVQRQLNVIVLAQNRRVDITLSTTGQQSVQLYPFNAVDAMTLLSEKAPAHEKNAAQKKAK